MRSYKFILYFCVFSWLSPFVSELGLRWLYVICQCALLSDSVRTLKDPILPGGQAAIDLGVHRFRTSETQRRLHARQCVRRQRCALLDRDADFIFPIEIVRRECHQSEIFGFFSVESFLLEDLFELVRLSQKTRLQTREAIAHRKRTRIQLGNRELRVGVAQHVTAIGSEQQLEQVSGKTTSW